MPSEEIRIYMKEEIEREIDNGAFNYVSGMMILLAFHMLTGTYETEFLPNT